MALLAAGLPSSWRRRVYALDGGPFAVQVLSSGVPVEVHARRRRYDPLPLAALWHCILATRPDVVHSWGWISTLVAGPVCRVLGVPLIDGAIRTGALQPDSLRLKRLGMGMASLIVANSEAGIRSWGVDHAKGRVVHNGFDWSRLSATGDACGSGAAALRPEDSTLTVVMTGRMGMWLDKDYRAVLAAARILRNDEPPCRFLLIGHGQRRDELVAEAADLIADGTVAFPDPDLEVLGHVRSAHVGVLMTAPTWGQEGCSNAIMEYMACGLPVVCSDGGGNREVVDDGRTGFVIPPADPRALAERIAYLRDNEDERRALGDAGRERISSHFSVSRMVRDYVSLYWEVLSSAGDQGGSACAS